ncbi:unnamed protein product [Lasius platythorax]|uniref:Uncharacterized protein n=1 Tax=Lasius platythorax TaxID=488582 RepID=A0AAV2MWT4_9HYME
MESSQQDQIQYGEPAVIRETTYSKSDVKNKLLTAKMNIKEDLEKMYEEENILIQRIQQKAKLQAVYKKQQDRLKILRKLAGTDGVEATSQTETEIEEMLKSQQR